MTQKQLSEKELSEKMQDWLPYIQAEKTLEVVYPDGKVSNITGVADLMSFIKSGDEIRLKVEPTDESEAEPVKCKEWFIDDAETPALAHRLPVPKDGLTRVIEPLGWHAMDDIIRPLLKIHGIPTCPMLDRLKEAGMIAEETE